MFFTLNPFVIRKNRNPKGHQCLWRRGWHSRVKSEARRPIHRRRGTARPQHIIDPSLGWVLLAAHDINDAGQIVGYAFNNFTASTHAVRLQPATTPPPECTFNYLRSTTIGLSAKTTGSDATVTAKIAVRDEKGVPMANALVVGHWTLPGGSEFQPNAWTDLKGIATFIVTGTRPGTYKFQVVNIVLSLHTFNPSKSVISRSIIVQ